MYSTSAGAAAAGRRIQQGSIPSSQAMGKRRSGKWLLMLGAVLAAGWLAAGPALAQEVEAPPWWDGRWRYRTLVRVEGGGAPAARAWIHVREGADAGGRDVRVIAPDGQRAPFDVLFTGRDGNNLVAFSTGGTPGLYAVYYGNPNAGDAPHEAPEWGLVLETRPIPKDADTSTWLATSRVLDKETRVYGADFWPRIFDGLNPFGPESDYIAIYHGYIRVPVDGTYRFAVISDHSAYLLIDDQPTASWPGPHDIGQGRKGEHSGPAALKAGIHKFLYVHFSYGNARRCEAAWMPPGKDWWEIIPPSAFPMPLDAQVYQTEEYRQTLCADFTYQPQTYLEVADARMVGLQFASVSSAGESVVSGYEWDFGDGQTGTDARPAHIYLAPGLYSATLRITSAGSLRALVTKKVDAKPAWQDLSFTRGKLERALEAAGSYKLDRLPTPSLLAAWSLFKAGEAQDKAVEAALQLDTRRKDITPDQLYQVAMDLAHFYQSGDQPPKAEAYYQLASDTAAPGDRARRFEARFGLCDLHFSGMNDPERARAEFLKLREDFPQADPARRREALIRIGDTWRSQSKSDEALKVYKQAESDPAYLPDQPRRLVVAAGLQAAESYLHNGDAEEAGKRLDELLWRYPTMRLEGRPASLRVQAVLMQGKFKEARRQADAFIAFSRDANYLPTVHLAAAEACTELGLPDQAADHYRKIVNQFPESPEAPEAQDALKKLGE